MDAAKAKVRAELLGNGCWGVFTNLAGRVLPKAAGYRGAGWNALRMLLSMAFKMYKKLKGAVVDRWKDHGLDHKGASKMAKFRVATSAIAGTSFEVMAESVRVGATG